jgi:hypothetical protein
LSLFVFDLVIDLCDTQTPFVHELYADDLGVTVDALELEDFDEQLPAPVEAAAAEPVEALDSDDDHHNTDTDLHVS